MKHTAQHGFTLIELLVSVTILIMLFGFGMTSYLHFNDNQTAIVAGQQLQLMLRTAQKKARVGDKPIGCVALQGYQVSGSTAVNAVIQLNTICDNGVLTLAESYTLPNGVRLSQALLMKFKVLTGGTDQPGTVTLTGSTGTTYSFTVGAGGDIGEGAIVAQ